MIAPVSLSTRSRQDDLSAPPSPPATRPGRSGWRDPRLFVGVALVALFFAVVNIKDYFWYRQGLSFTIAVNPELN